MYSMTEAGATLLAAGVGVHVAQSTCDVDSVPQISSESS